MGSNTRDQLVSEGQLLAGRDDMATQCATWLQRWLDSVAASWRWPALQQEAVNVNLPAGTTALTVGNGSAGITDKILVIHDNVWIYETSRNGRQRVRIKHQLSSPVDSTSPANYTGKPQSIRVFASTFGKWILKPDPTPDQAYLITVPYNYVPIALTAGTDIPWYPNDETMVQAIAFKVSEYHNGKDASVTQAFQEALAGMVSNDRMRYGSVPGINDSMILSPSVFRTKGNGR